MGVVIGPFDKDDWFAMNQYRLDLSYLRNPKNKTEDTLFAEKEIAKKYKTYITREAA